MAEHSDHPTNPSDNPYPGPRPFRPGEQLYGRDTEITQLFYLLSAERIVVLHSPSGAGKSSLVQAGLVPRLQSERFDVWPNIRLSLQPGGTAPSATGGNQFVQSVILSLEDGLPERRQRPFEQIAHQSLTEYLAERPRRPRAPSSVVLIFDQFEEIVTLDPLNVEAKREFFQQLGDLLHNHDIWALFSLREDYLAPLDPYRDDVPTRLNNTFRIDLLDIAAGREAISKPAADAGRMFANAAVQQLADDLATVSVQQPDGSFQALTGRYVEPVQLQVVCRRLWDQLPADTHTIGVEHLQTSGDVNEALSAYYDGCLAELASDDIAAERRLREWFSQRLITPGGIRGQVLRGQDDSGGLDNDSIARLLDTHLVRSEQRSGATWYELAHDRLVAPVSVSNTAWFEDKLHPLQRQAALWDRAQRPNGLLFHDEDLDEAERWAEAHPESVAAGSIEQDFLERCREARKIEEQQRQLTAERAERAEEQIRYAATLKKRLMAVTLVSVIAIGAFFVAVYQGAKAQTKNAIATATLAKNLLPTTPVEGHVLAIAATDLSQSFPSVFQPVPLEVQSSLVEAIQTSRLGIMERTALSGHTGVVRSVAISPDGQTIVSGSADQTLRLWNGDGALLGKPFQGHTWEVWSVAFSPDGQTIASGSFDQTVQLWDTTGTPLGAAFQGHTGGLYAVAFSPDGQTLVSASSDETIRVWNSAGQPLGEPFRGNIGVVRSVAFSPDGQTIVSGGEDMTVRLWDLTGTPIGFPFLGHSGVVYSVAFSPDGQTIVSGGEDMSVRLWDTTGTPLGEPFQGHTGEVLAVAFSPDGQTIVSGSYDKTVRVWDVTGKPLSAPFRGHTGGVHSVAFSPDGQTIVSGSYDQTVRVWDVADRLFGEPFRGHEGGILAVAFSPDGQTIVSAGADQTVRLWDVSGKLRGEPFQAHTAEVLAVAVSPDGRTVVSTSADQTVRLWDVTGKLLGTPIRGHEEVLWSVAFSPDGQTLVTGGSDQTVRLWDVAGNPLGEPFQGHEGGVLAVAFSPDGQTIVSGGEDTSVRLWDLAGNLLVAPFRGHTGEVLAVAFSPDGQAIVSGGEDASVRLWDLAGNPLVAPFRGHQAAVSSVAFSSDGQTIVSGSRDETVRVWNRAGQPRGVPFRGHEGMVQSVAFSPDGQTIVSGGADSHIRLWPIGTVKTWLQIVCDNLRNHSVLRHPRTQMAYQAQAVCRPLSGM